MDFVYVSIIIASILLVIALIIKSEQQKPKKDNQYYTNMPQQISYTAPQQYIPYMPYTRKNLLTKTEYNFYNTLKNICDEYNLLICPKVRLEDIAEVTDKQNLMKYRGYIKSRHVDFIICDSQLYALCAIELDDYSHNYAKAQQTDEFKNNFFNAIQLPLYRIKVGSIYRTELESILYLLGVKRPDTSNITNTNTEKTDLSTMIEKQNSLLEKQNTILEELKKK